MRTKTIIDGLKNSQKFRVIFKGDGSENDIGMYMTIQQMTEMFATVNSRVLCWDALLQLGRMRLFAQKDGKPVTPQQIDLCNDKGNYAPNITAFTSQRYPLAYPLSVIYLRDNRQEPIGEKFAEILKTTQVQCLLSETGLIPLRKLDIATCNSYQ